MSIASTTSRVDYIGNGATAVYSYTFRIFESTDLKVTARDVDDVETLLIEGLHYTVDGVGDEFGGDITLLAGAFTWMDGNFLDSGAYLTIRRVKEITQETDIRNQGDFFPEVHEDAFDGFIMIDQQQQDEINRSLKLPESVSAGGFDPTLPAEIDGAASVVIGTNPAGNGFVVGPTFAEIENANADAEDAEQSALLAQAWATKTDDLVEAIDNSSKAYAIGGTGGGQPTAGDAKSWATKLTTTVNGAEYSAKEYASGSSAPTGTSKDWASKTSAAVAGGEFSSKEWARGIQTRGLASGGSSKDWANYTGGTVDNTEFSAKKYAENAAQSAIDAATAASASLWTDVVFLTFANSPYNVLANQSGTMFSVDTTGGSVVINLPTIAGLNLSPPWAIGVKKADATTNTITVTPGGTDTIDGAANKVVSRSLAGLTLIPDVDATPDMWTSISFGEVPISGAIVGTTDTQVLTNKDIDGGTASNARRLTVPQNTKANLDALTRKEATLVYANDLDKLYVDDGIVLKSIGSGVGSGVNFLNLTTAWSPDLQDNSDAETSTGNWATFADAAASTPADMTGGTATQLTFSRTNTAGEILNGTYSFKLVKAAANAQGQGLSCTANIPPAYQGKDATIRFPFRTTGTLVEGDVKIFIYDVTNAQLITPSRNDIISASGTIAAKFPVPNMAGVPANIQVRVGIYFATTVTTATTIFFDDVYVGPEVKAEGALITDWQQFTMTIGGSTSAPTKGTNSIDSAWWRRVGDSMEIIYNYIQTGAGSAGNGTYLFPIPMGLSVDSTKLANTSTPYGTASCGIASVLETATENPAIMRVYNATNLAMAKANSISDYVDVGSGNAQMSLTTLRYSFMCKVPIVGWSSNLGISNSSYYLMSNFLVNGTRVTGTAPTALGQYRTYLRNANVRTYTETNGAPGTTITTANGLPLYAGNAYSAADTNNAPTRWEIFIGKNKNFSTFFYQTTGRTGYINTDMSYAGGASTDYGIGKSYDPTTGILQIFHPRSGSATGHTVSSDINYFAANGTIGGYFDILVFDNAVSVGVDTPQSSIWVTGGNGHGSTNNKVRRFVTIVEQVGTDIIFTQSGTLGDTFTFNRNGIYSISYFDRVSAGTSTFGLSLNSAQLTTSVNTITNSTRLALGVSGGNISTAPVTKRFRTGDILRAHTDGTVDGTTDIQVIMHIVRISD